MQRSRGRAFQTGRDNKSKGPELEMRLIYVRGRKRSAWQNVVKHKTVVRDDVREAGRARISRDESKREGTVSSRGRWLVLPRS